MIDKIEVPGGKDRFIVIQIDGKELVLTAPILNIDEQRIACAASLVRDGAPVTLTQGVTETIYCGSLIARNSLQIQLRLRHRPNSSFLRYSFRITGDATLSKLSGHDDLTYVTCDLSPYQQIREIRLSEFEPLTYGYQLQELPLAPEHFRHKQAVFGPIVCAAGPTQAMLLAYEHGSMLPDAFLHLRGRENTSLAIEAVKGNYCAGQNLRERPFESVWLEVGFITGGLDDLATAYRTFILDDLSANLASRRPNIYYNTWNYQERNKSWNGKPYLESMRQERILAEIEIAHRMGIDVFVLDTGWYCKTGDWQVDPSRFDAGLKSVRKALQQCGMKLGLWFGPMDAAVSSRLATVFPDCIVTKDGVASKPRPVWETEDSHRMCLVSRYWEGFADELIRLHRELGVTYFKWDAIDQYGCDSPLHAHGDQGSTVADRADHYAFEQVRFMGKIIDRLCAACPEAIVDFDVTEPHRAVGLAFLASGKYFLMNNGPYYRTLGDPQYAPGGGMGSNVLVFPGPARAGNCRKSLGFDRWIPSVLFLTHYLPDAPASSQELNIASLVLGHNGIWGDLLRLTPEEIERFGLWLGLYKQVCNEIIRAAPVQTGTPNGTPEIHEKIDRVTGRGAICIFTPFAGIYEYITRNRVAQTWRAMPGIQVEILPDGVARITLSATQAMGATVFFGVQ